MTKTDTAAQRLEDLLTKRTELQADFDSLGARLRDEQKRDIVEALKEGSDIDDLLQPVVDARNRLKEKIELQDRAIREQSEIVEAARVVRGREARERLRGEYEARVSRALAALEKARAAAEAVEDVNRDLRAEGFSGFAPLAFPVNFMNWDRRLETFRAVCSVRGLNI